MKVVLDARLIMNDMTGIGRYLLGILKGFTDLHVDFDLEVWVQKHIRADHPVWRYQNERTDIKRIPFRHMTLSQYWKIPRLLTDVSPDVFRYPHFDLPFFVKYPVISTIHDLKYIVHPEFFTKNNKFKRLLISSLMASTIKRSEFVVGVSESTKRDLLSFFNVPEEKIVVIYEGVEEYFFEEQNPEFVQKILNKYHIDKPFILFVGERRPHKNIDGLIKVFVQFKEMVLDNYLLVIAGKKYANYQLPEQIVEELGLQRSVAFIERLSDDELRAFYQAAELFITLSKYEGFGLPLLEAMAAGTPIVSANTTSLPEVVGNAGVLVDSEEHDAVARTLEELVVNTDKREFLAKLGRERAREFTWEKYASHLASLYYQVGGLV